MAIGYVLRTDKLSKPYYFSGAIEDPIGTSIVITSLIFNAWTIKSEKEANKLQKTLGDDWTVSKTLSDGYGQKAKPEEVDEFFKRKIGAV